MCTISDCLSRRPAAAWIALVLCAGSATAQGAVAFCALDQDGNGLVSEQEFTAVREKRRSSRAERGLPVSGAADPQSFSALDQNGDGQLTLAEYDAFQQRREAREVRRVGRETQ